MDEHKEKRTRLKEIENSRGMPQPLGWIADFINRFFPKMPKTVQVVVFLAFVAYFMFATLRLLWPVLFPTDYIEIRGEVTGQKCLPLPDSLSIMEFSGEGLFVYKKPVGIGDQFTYDWILKIPRSKVDEKQWLALTWYNPIMKRPVILTSKAFSAKELKDHCVDGKVHLEIDSSITNISVASCNREANNLLSSLSELFVKQAIAQPQNKMQKAMPLDSINFLLRQYEKVRNPVVQLQIIKTFSTADTSAVLVLAENLKEAVIENKKTDIAVNAPLLSNSDLLAIFTADGKYAALFDSLFYSKAVQLIHTGAVYECQSIAKLLHNLQDPRSVNHIFQEFSRTDSPKAKQLFLYILEGFAKTSKLNLKIRIKKKLEQWLEEAQHGEERSRINKTIKQTLFKFM